jgi:transcriptional regulator with XRE-family HTH domain
MPRAEESGLFAALLRHWRTKRGLSQLDLSSMAEVSSRHLSFLETGRAQPSQEMVLVLGGVLDLSMRDQNALLRAAGFKDHFAEPNFAAGLPAPIERALERMLAKHEPYPMLVMNHAYDILKFNSGALRVMSHCVLEPPAPGAPFNLMHALFSPRLVRPFVVGWELVARTMLLRLQREALARPGDVVLSGLLNDLLAYPDVPTSFRQLDLASPSEPTLAVQLRRAALELSFLTTVTVFNAPQNVTLEELRIESYFPLDDRTEQSCQQLATAGCPLP